MTRILCLGMSALDSIYRVPAIPATATKVLATSYAQSGGGMAANASVAAARLGGKVSYWGRVGDDAIGQRILDDLVAEGIDITDIRLIEGCVSPSAAILVDDDGERLVCAYNDPKLDHDASWLPVHTVWAFDAVLADVRWPEGAAAVLDAATAAGIPAVFDGDVGPIEDLLDLAGRATHAIFSEPGLAQVSGTSSPSDGLARIASMLKGVIGVTLGPNGVLWRVDGHEHWMPPPKVEVIDTLAAGDVWHGAFTLALGEHLGISDAARFANAAAALKCTRPGGRQGAPHRAEVTALLKASN